MIININCSAKQGGKEETRCMFLDIEETSTFLQSTDARMFDSDVKCNTVRASYLKILIKDGEDLCCALLQHMEEFKDMVFTPMNVYLSLK
jgi:hypothetical protein